MRTMKRLLRTYITWLESLIAEPRPVVSDTPAPETVSLHQNTDIADDAVQTSALFATDERDASEHPDKTEVESAGYVRPNGFVRVISFLGVGSMNETEYYLERDASTGIKTRFAGYAAHQLIHADETLFSVQQLPKRTTIALSESTPSLLTNA